MNFFNVSLGLALSVMVTALFLYVVWPMLLSKCQSIRRAWYYLLLPAENKRKCVCGDLYMDHNNDDDDEGHCVIIGCYCKRFEEVDPP